MWHIRVQAWLVIFVIELSLMHYLYIIMHDISIKQQLYNIKKIESYFNDEYFKNSSLTYAPVRSKWGRISFDATVVKSLEAVWVRKVWF
jgi:hypothetical protein